MFPEPQRESFVLLFPLPQGCLPFPNHGISVLLSVSPPGADASADLFRNAELFHGYKKRIRFAVGVSPSGRLHGVPEILQIVNQNRKRP